MVRCWTIDKHVFAVLSLLGEENNAPPLPLIDSSECLWPGDVTGQLTSKKAMEDSIPYASICYEQERHVFVASQFICSEIHLGNFSQDLQFVTKCSSTTSET